VWLLQFRPVCVAEGRAAVDEYLDNLQLLSTIVNLNDPHRLSSHVNFQAAQVVDR
jgi:hypothetical protein